MSFGIEVLAPAKVNLFLHVTGRRSDNYHTLQSHIMFTNIGDLLTIESYDDYNLEIQGRFSKDLDSTDNLVTLAAHRFCKLINEKPNLKVTLEKIIPLGAGLGGGSSDAAAIIKGLIEFFNVDIASIELNRLLEGLGADIPACFYGQSCFVEGIGEKILPAATPSLHAVLIYPNLHCDTESVFKNFNQNFSDKIQIEKNFSDTESLISFLKSQKNDLTESAISVFSDIKKCLTILEEEKNIQFARMTGSGSSCFGVVENLENAEIIARKIHNKNPDWWVCPVTLS
jgi:4-diphosphocytidyl-2-C-methyl-D-erythritol kinase